MPASRSGSGWSTSAPSVATSWRRRGASSCGGVEAMDAKAGLTAASVQVSVTLRSSGRLGFPADAPDELVRASPHYYNDDADLDALVSVVTDLARRRARS